MSNINPGPIGPATTSKRGTMSAIDKAKVDALSGTNTGDVTVSSVAGWLSLAGQALTFALVSASQTVAGVVDLAAQTFAGVKTFVAEAVFSAGLVSSGVRAIGASLLLRSDLGAGASDVCVRIGPSTADGSVHASAKIASWGTGNGGTFVEYFNITKTTVFLSTVDRMITCGGSVTPGAAGNFGYTTSGNGWEFYGVGMYLQGNLNLQGTLQLGGSGSARPTANASNRGKFWYSKSAGGAADTVQVCLKSAGDTYSWVTIATG